MRRFRPAMRSSNFITWPATDDLPPTWNDAARRITTDDQPTDGHPVDQPHERYEPLDATIDATDTR